MPDTTYDFEPEPGMVSPLPPPLWREAAGGVHYYKRNPLLTCGIMEAGVVCGRPAAGFICKHHDALLVPHAGKVRATVSTRLA